MTMQIVRVALQGVRDAALGSTLGPIL
jgi:hypothetical protein